MSNRNRRPWAEGWEELHIQQLADKLRPYRDDIDELLRCAQAFPEEREAIRQLMAEECQARGQEFDDPFCHPFPAQLGKGDIFVCNAEPSGLELRLGDAEVPLGFGLLGSSGTGKTTAGHNLVYRLWQRGFRLLIIDLRGDWLGLALMIHDLLVIPLKRLRLNPLCLSRHIPPEEWDRKIAARLTLDFLMKVPGKSYAVQMLQKLRADASRKNVEPTLPELFELVQRQAPRPGSSRDQIRERLLDRLDMVISGCGTDVLAVQRGHPLVEMIEQGRAVLLDLSRADRTVADFLSSLLLHAIYEDRLHAGALFDPQRKCVVVVLDEQRGFLQKGDPTEQSELSLLVSRSRAVGVSLCVCEQHPSMLHPAVVNALHTRLAFRTKSPESAFVGYLLGLDKRQEEVLQSLEPGRAIASLGSEIFPTPFLVNVPLLREGGLRICTDEEHAVLEAAVERSVQELSAFVVPWSPVVGVPEKVQAGPSQAPQDQEPLTDYAVQAMQAIYRFFWETIDERCSRLGMDRGKEWRARGLLTRYGLIELVVKISKVEFFGATEKGLAWAKKRGIPRLKFKSGLAHEVVIRRLRISIVAAELGASFKVHGTFQGVQYDLLILLPGGIVIACQVSATNSVKYESDRLVRLAAEPAVDAVLMVTLEKKAQRIRKRVEEELIKLTAEASNGTGGSKEQCAPGEAMPDAGERTTRELLKKIRIYDAAEVLNRKFDWRALFTELGALEEDQEDE